MSCSETSIASARASVMIYDDLNKKWVPSGSSSGLSKVNIFQHNYNNTFRVVGRKLHDHEVVINCVILRSLKYNQATDTFHQWRDNKQVYGLNFSSKNDADTFARAMNYAVEILTASKLAAAAVNNIGGALTNHHSNVNTDAYQIIQHAANVNNNNSSLTNNTNIQYDEDMGYRTMTKEDMAVLQDRCMSQQSQLLNSPGSVSSTCSANSMTMSSPSQQQQQVQQSSSSGSASGHQRTSSAPPAPQPPLLPLSLNTTPTPTPTCTSPPHLSTPLIPSPPCPPPLPNCNMIQRTSTDSEQGSLALQLQSARLNRSNKAATASNSSSGSSSNYGTLNRSQGGGIASMMDEMAKTLARRRAAIEKKDPSGDNQEENESILERSSNSSSRKGSNCMNGGSESPKPIRKLLNSSEELTNAKIVNGELANLLPAELESLKEDIIRELKKEIFNMKEDIIEAIRSEIGRK